MKKLLLLLLLLTGCPDKDPKPNPEPPPPPKVYEYKNAGLAYYAMLSDRWPCEDSYQSIKPFQKIRLSILWNSFGKNTACLKRFMADNRFQTLEMHIINEVCQRNGNCSPNEFLRGISKDDYEKKIKNKDGAMLNKIRGWAQDAANNILPLRRPGMECYISPGLESNLSNDAGKVLLDLMKPIFPGCEMVWNGNKIIGGVIKESHGSNPNLVPACIANLDGEDISFNDRPSQMKAIHESKIPEYFNRYQGCRANFLWITEFNGRWPNKWEETLKRTNWPSRKMFDNVVRISTGK